MWSGERKSWEGQSTAPGRVGREGQEEWTRPPARMSPPPPAAAAAAAAVCRRGAGGGGRGAGALAGRRRGPAPAQAGGSEGKSAAGTEVAQLAVGLGSLVALDKGLKAAFLSAGIRFPSALCGMFLILSGICALSSVDEGAAQRVYDFFYPALQWVTRWLPLFYVPSLVTLPAALAGIPGADLGRIGVLMASGVVLSLWATASLTVFIRNLTRTEVLPPAPVKGQPPFTRFEQAAAAGTAVVSFAVALAVPSLALPASVPFFVAATVGGYLFGSALPAGVRTFLHPILTTALVAQAAAVLYGGVTGVGFFGALQIYLSKGSGPLATGAGDVLMGFLGTVILSFGFRLYEQRALLRRHAVEIIGTVVVSAAFSLFATVGLGHLLGLSSQLSLAVAPRSVTVALALPIGDLLGAGDLSSVTAGAVVITGLIGANFCQRLLDAFGFKDPIVRGMSTAASAHGLGTAALAAKEPDALPFCALAYALIGISASVLAALPPVQTALIALAG